MSPQREKLWVTCASVKRDMACAFLQKAEASAWLHAMTMVTATLALPYCDELEMCKMSPASSEQPVLSTSECLDVNHNATHTACYC